MANINMETNSELKEGLARLGFKKKKGLFVREQCDALQDIGFIYATHGEKQTRYYNPICGFSYPEASSIAEKIGVMLADTGGNIGYLIPQRSLFFRAPIYQFLEWRICANDSEEQVHKTVNDLLFRIEKYVIPYFDELNTKEAFIKILDNNPQKITFFYDRKLPPILYYLLGRSQDALRYTQYMLDLYKKQEEGKENGTIIKNTNEYKDIIVSGGSNYKVYRDFADKFILEKISGTVCSADS